MPDHQTSPVSEDAERALYEKHARDEWKERRGGRRMKRKRRRFQAERRFGWDRRARVAVDA